MNEAIKLAIEKGGYDTHGWSPSPEGITHDSMAITVIDPLFWQALGRALGWDFQMDRQKCNNPECERAKGLDWASATYCFACGKELEHFTKTTTNWKSNWQSLINWLAEGKNIDDFFTNLIK